MLCLLMFPGNVCTPLVFTDDYYRARAFSTKRTTRRIECEIISLSRQKRTRHYRELLSDAIYCRVGATIATQKCVTLNLAFGSTQSDVPKNSTICRSSAPGNIPNFGETIFLTLKFYSIFPQFMYFTCCMDTNVMQPYMVGGYRRPGK